MRRVGLVALVLLTVLLPVSVALAAGEQGAAPEATRIAVQAAAREDGRVALTARVSGPAGAPVGNREVDFYLKTAFFAERLVYLGSRTTDTAGTAVLTYQPGYAGAHQFMAYFPGSATLAPAEAAAALQVPAAPPIYAPGAEVLVSIRRGVSMGVVALLAVVWLAILGVLARVAVGVARAREVMLADVAEAGYQTAEAGSP